MWKLAQGNFVQKAQAGVKVKAAFIYTMNCYIVCMLIGVSQVTMDSISLQSSG